MNKNKKNINMNSLRCFEALLLKEVVRKPNSWLSDRYNLIKESNDYLKELNSLKNSVVIKCKGVDRTNVEDVISNYVKNNDTIVMCPISRDIRLPCGEYVKGNIPDGYMNVSTRPKPEHREEYLNLFRDKDIKEVDKNIEQMCKTTELYLVGLNETVFEKTLRELEDYS